MLSFFPALLQALFSKRFSTFVQGNLVSIAGLRKEGPRAFGGEFRIEAVSWCLHRHSLPQAPQNGAAAAAKLWCVHVKNLTMQRVKLDILGRVAGEPDRSAVGALVNARARLLFKAVDRMVRGWFSLTVPLVLVGRVCGSVRLPNRLSGACMRLPIFSATLACGLLQYGLDCTLAALELLDDFDKVLAGPAADLIVNKGEAVIAAKYQRSRFLLKWCEPLVSLMGCRCLCLHWGLLGSFHCAFGVCLSGRPCSGERSLRRRISPSEKKQP